MNNSLSEIMEGVLCENNNRNSTNPTRGLDTVPLPSGTSSDGVNVSRRGSLLLEGMGEERSSEKEVEGLKVSQDDAVLNQLRQLQHEMMAQDILRLGQPEQKKLEHKVDLEKAQKQQLEKQEHMLLLMQLQQQQQQQIYSQQLEQFQQHKQQSLQQLQLSSSASSSQPQSISSTAAIYFCFMDDKFDKPEHPNKLILARSLPTVADVCSTMKAIFFTNQDVVLSCTFMLQEYPENSQNPVPVNDRNNVILIKNRYHEGASKITPQSIQDNLEIINIFQKQKVTLENMKYLKDTDLQNFGITNWEIKIAILEAIQKFYIPPLPQGQPVEMDSPFHSSDEDNSPSREIKRRASYAEVGSGKKLKQERTITLQRLPTEPIIPQDGFLNI